MSNLNCGFIEEDAENYLWRPKESDKSKKIDIIFKEAKSVEELWIYEDFYQQNRIKSIEIIYDDSETEQIKKTGSMDEIIWKIPIGLRVVKKISIRIKEYEGIPGIAEIEIYDHKVNFWNDCSIGLKSYVETGIEGNKKSLVQYIEYLYLNMKLLVKYKIKHEIINKIKKR